MKPPCVVPSAKYHFSAGPATAVSACAPYLSAAVHDIVRSTTSGWFVSMVVENSATSMPLIVLGSTVTRVRAGTGT